MEEYIEDADWSVDAVRFGDYRGVCGMDFRVDEDGKLLTKPFNLYRRPAICQNILRCFSRIGEHS